MNVRSLNNLEHFSIVAQATSTFSLIFSLNMQYRVFTSRLHFSPLTTSQSRLLRLVEKVQELNLQLIRHGHKCAINKQQKNGIKSANDVGVNTRSPKGREVEWERKGAGVKGV